MIALSEFSCPVDDGVVLRGVQRRGGDGEPLVMVHGYSDSWRSYQPLMRELPPSMRLVAFSLRGHGDSSKPAGAYGTEVMARDVTRVMDHLGISRAVIVGHSMGSLVAQRLAQDHAGRVSRLVLIGAFATLKGNPGAEGLWRDAVSAMTDPVPPAFAREFQSSCLARPVPEEFLAEVVAESLKLPAHVWRSALEAVMNEDRRNLLGRIAAPTTILWGDHDAFCARAEQEQLARSIAGARLVVYEGTGHAPHWEEPARAAADLVAAASVRGAARVAA